MPPSFPWGTGYTNFASLFYSTNVAQTGIEIDLRFTEIAANAAAANRREILHNSGYAIDSLSLRDCRVYGGTLFTYTGANQNTALMIFGFTNTLLFRTDLQLIQEGLAGAEDTPFWARFWNCTFYGGNVALTNNPFASTNIAPWAVYDTAWIATTLSGSGTIPNSHNAYAATAALSGGSDNLTVTNANFQAGPGGGEIDLPGFGSSQSLYGLVNSGNRSAASAGLFWHSTQAGQTQETTSTVDPGFHYAATTGPSSTTPTDWDADELFDVLEDSNGNGTADLGETDWNDPFDLGFLIYITQPKAASNIP